MAINQATLDAYRAKGYTDAQIAQQISTKYGDNSTQLKEFNAFVTPKPATTPAIKPIVTTTTTTKPITSSVPTSAVDKPIVTAAKTIVTTPVVKPAVVPVVKSAIAPVATPAITIDQNTLNKLRQSGKTDEELRSAVSLKYGDNSEQLKAFNTLVPKATNYGLQPDGTTIIKQTKKNIPNIGTATKVDMIETKNPIVKTKQNKLTELQKTDVTSKNLEYSLGSKILATNNQNILDLYGIDQQGNIDPTKTNSFSAKIEQSKKEYETTKNKLLGDYSSARLRSVQSQMRRMLAERGIDITKISPEQLIQLSGEVGATAFNDIFTAKEKTVNDILTNNKDAESKLNLLREKGLLSANDMKVATETLRAKTKSDINTINKQFVNDIFGLQDKTIAEEKTAKSEAINAITKLGASLGLKGSKLDAITFYINNYDNANDALMAMLADLRRESSPLRQNVLSTEEAAKMAAQATALLESRKVAADEARANAAIASANKPSTTSENYPAWKQQVSAFLPKPIGSVTEADWDKAILDPNFRDFQSKGTVTIPQNKGPTLTNTYSNLK